MTDRSGLPGKHERKHPWCEHLPEIAELTLFAGLYSLIDPENNLIWILSIDVVLTVL